MAPTTSNVQQATGTGNENKDSRTSEAVESSTGSAGGREVANHKACRHCGQSIEFSGNPPRWRHSDTKFLTCTVHGRRLDHFAEPEDAA